MSPDVSHFLNDHGLEGRFVGSKLHRLINEEIVPFLSDRIASHLAPFSMRKTIEYLGARLGNVARAHAGTVIGRGIGARQEVWQHSVRQATGNTRTWQLILEMALVRLPSGSRSHRGLDERSLFRIADDLYFWSQLSDRLHYSLGDPTLIIDSSRSLVTGLNRILDLGLSNHQLTEWMKDRGDDETFGPLGDLALALAEGRCPPDSEYAAKVDAAFNASLGFTLSTFLRLMVVLANNTSALVSRSSELIKRYELDTWVTRQGLPDDAARAVDFLVFHGHPGPLVASRLYESRQRLNTHPLPALPEGRILLIPSWVATSATVYSKYLVEAAWPATLGEELEGTELRVLLDDEERALNRKLEVEIIENLWEAGYPAYGPVGSGDQIGIPDMKLPGEIDVLALDPNNRRVVAIEAKDERQIHSMKGISRQVRKWWIGEASHAAKLLNKVSAVSPYVEHIPKAVAKLQNSLHLAAAPPGMLPHLAEDEHWRVACVIVTREPTMAGAYSDRSVPTVWLTDLLRFMETTD